MKARITKGSMTIEVEDASAADLAVLLNQSDPHAEAGESGAEGGAGHPNSTHDTPPPPPRPRSPEEKWIAFLAPLGTPQRQILAVIKERGHVIIDEVVKAAGMDKKQRVNGYMARASRSAKEAGLDYREIVEMTAEGYVPNRIVTFHAGRLLRAHSLD